MFADTPKPSVSALRLLAAVALLAGSSAVAQVQGPSADAVTEEPVREFALTLIDTGTKEVFYRSGGTEYFLLPPGRARTRERYRYQGASPIVFYDKVTNAEGEVVERPIARAAFPDSYRQMLILIQPRDDRWTQTRTIVLDDALAAFPADSARVLNISLYPLACAINGKQFALERGEDRIIRLGDHKGVIDWKIAARMEGEWKLVRSSAAQFLPGMRELIIVNVAVADGGQPKLDIFAVSDRPRR